MLHLHVPYCTRYIQLRETMNESNTSASIAFSYGGAALPKVTTAKKKVCYGMPDFCFSHYGRKMNGKEKAILM